MFCVGTQVKQINCAFTELYCQFIYAHTTGYSNKILILLNTYAEARIYITYDTTHDQCIVISHSAQHICRGDNLHYL